MTGNDVKKLFDDLGLNSVGARHLVGLSKKEFCHVTEAGDESIDVCSNIPTLQREVLGELWSIVSSTYDTSTKDGSEGCLSYGKILAMEMFSYGPSYAVWLILNDRCSRIKEEALLAIEEVALNPGV